LKNAANPSTGAQEVIDAAVYDEHNRLAWDESNLTLHEIQRQQQDPRMKIDEPKTPFVRSASFGSIADEDIGFDLDGHSSAVGEHGQPIGNNHASLNNSKTLFIDVAANTKANAKASAELAASDNERSSGQSRSRQGSSSRSPSFTLPNSRRSSASGADRSRDNLRHESNERTGPADVDSAAVDDADNEDVLDDEGKAKQEEFARKRNAHYGNEAEAMKIAAALNENEDEDDEDAEDDANLLSTMDVDGAGPEHRRLRNPMPNGRQ
jgi:protein phosphatase inhibitor 2